MPTGMDKLDIKLEKRPFLTSSSGNFGGGSPGLNINNEYEIRKVIEREMEPYTFSIKNELRLMMDNFVKDLGEYKYLKSEINLTKETVQDNKKLILIFQEELERKFNDYSHKFQGVSKNFEEIKMNFGDFTKRVKHFEKLYEDIQERFNIVDSLKDRLLLHESSNEKMASEIEKSISTNVGNKIRSIENNIDNLKTSCNSVTAELNGLSLSNENMNKALFDLNRNKDNLTSDLNEIREKIISLGNNFSSQGNKLENLMSSNGLLGDKINILNKNQNSILEGQNNTDLSIEKLSEKVRILKDENNDKLRDLKDQCLNTNEEILKQLRQQNDRTNKLNDTTNETFRQTSDKIAQSNSEVQRVVNEITRNIQILDNSINVLKETGKNTDQLGFNSLIEKSLGEILKQNVQMNSEINNLKADGHRFETNFEKIQENFVKLKNSVPQETNAQNNSSNNSNMGILQEIIQALSASFENYKKSTDTKLQNNEVWKEQLLVGLKQNHDGLKGNVETTLNQFAQMNSSTFAKIEAAMGELAKAIAEKSTCNHKEQSSVNTTNNMNTVDKGHVQQLEKELVNVRKELSQQSSDNEEKITKLYKYFETKIEDLVDYIKLLSSKTEIPNNDNATNSNIIHNKLESYSGCSNYLTLMPSGIASNLNPALVLRGNPKNLKEANLSENKVDSMIKSSKNSIDEKWLKTATKNSKKFQSNQVYISHNPISFLSLKEKMPGYLKKYFSGEKQYGNVLEIEIDNHDEDENNNREDVSNLLDEISEDRVKETKRKDEEMYALDDNDVMFADMDDDSFDANSSYNDIISSKNESKY